MLKKTQKFGFTLIQTFTVMVVLAILVAVSIPSFRRTESKQRFKKDIQLISEDISFVRSSANIKRFCAGPTQSQSWTININNIAGQVTGSVDCNGVEEETFSYELYEIEVLELATFSAALDSYEEMDTVSIKYDAVTGNTTIIGDPNGLVAADEAYSKQARMIFLNPLTLERKTITINSVRGFPIVSDGGITIAEE